MQKAPIGDLHERVDSREQRLRILGLIGKKAAKVTVAALDCEVVAVHVHVDGAEELPEQDGPIVTRRRLVLKQDVERVQIVVLCVEREAYSPARARGLARLRQAIVEFRLATESDGEFFDGEL